jgi:DNA-binding GntR family transcriptional regulator
MRDRRALMLTSIRDVGGHEPLAQDIFDALAIDIVEGQLRPGDTLNSVDVARRFGTSRTPVREALTELERHGVVVIPPRRRPYVAYATLKQVRDVYEVRASLFALVSELIADHCPRERIAELDAWQQALEDDVACGNSGDYFWHNVGFRFIEAGLSGNGDLERMIKALGLRTLQLRHLSLSQPGQIQRSVADHRRLLRAYAERDKVAAVAMTRALIMGGYRAIERSGLVENEAGGELDHAAESGLPAECGSEPGSTAVQEKKVAPWHRCQQAVRLPSHLLPPLLQRSRSASTTGFPCSSSP